MRLLLAAAVLGATVLAAPASAAPPTFAGDVCWYDLSDADSILVHGGPIAVAYVPGGTPLVDVFDNPAELTLTCTVRQGRYATHTDPHLGAVSASGRGVVAVPPTLVPVGDVFDQVLGVCTVVTANGVPYYWDSWEEEFTTDPDVRCIPVPCPTSSDDPCDGGSHFPPSQVDELGSMLIDVLNDLPIDEVDPLVCSKLADVAPPEGDIEGVWDCPPYAS